MNDLSGFAAREAGRSWDLGDDIEYADVYRDIPEVVNALNAGKYTHTDHAGVICPSCQRGLER